MNVESLLRHQIFGHEENYPRMKNSIWLFLYLILQAKEPGGVKIKSCEAAQTLGVSRKTLLKWLKILRACGYVLVKRTGRGLTVHIRGWNEEGDLSDGFPESGQGLPDGPPENDYSGRASGAQNLGQSGEKEEVLEKSRPSNRIDTIINKFNNNRIDRECPEKFHPASREEALALEIAGQLDDYKNLPLYLSYCKRYPESLIWRVAGEVKEIPFEKIKKSRGALFNYLIQRYAKETK